MRKVLNSIYNILMFVCPALVFAFMSQPFVTLKLGQAIVNNTDGYSLINFEAEGMNLAISILVVATLAIAGIMVLTSITGIFKNSRPGIFRGLMLLLLMATTVAIAILISKNISAVEGLVTVGWGAIVCPCLAFGAFVGYNLSRASIDKNKKIKGDKK